MHIRTPVELGAFRFKDGWEAQGVDITGWLIKMKMSKLFHFVMIGYYSGGFQMAGFWLNFIIPFLGRWLKFLL